MSDHLSTQAQGRGIPAEHFDRPVTLTYLLVLQALPMFGVLALALHLDPVFVGALHLSRFLLVSLLVPFLAHRLRKDTQKPPRERYVRRPDDHTERRLVDFHTPNRRQRHQQTD